MMILEAQNITPGGNTADGLSDYHVELRINRRVIWRGEIKGHTRVAGAATLLRLIADEVEKKEPRESWTQFQQRMHTRLKKMIATYEEHVCGKQCRVAE